MSPSTSVVYIDDTPQAVPHDSIPAFWLAAGAHSQHLVMPHGTVISISLQQMQPMAAHAVLEYIRLGYDKNPTWTEFPLALATTSG